MVDRLIDEPTPHASDVIDMTAGRTPWHWRGDARRSSGRCAGSRFISDYPQYVCVHCVGGLVIHSSAFTYPIQFKPRPGHARPECAAARRGVPSHGAHDEHRGVHRGHRAERPGLPHGPQRPVLRRGGVFSTVCEGADGWAWWEGGVYWAAKADVDVLCRYRFSYGKLGREANVQGAGAGAQEVVGQEEKRDPRDFVLWCACVCRRLAPTQKTFVRRGKGSTDSCVRSLTPTGSPPRRGSPWPGPPPGVTGGPGGTSSARP